VGKEPITYIVGTSAEDVVNKIQSLLGAI
jgi:predicted fused transcriptional regulator/phosphomethylpyrimidine kinase